MTSGGKGEKVLVFGGSFDPPHHGHLNLLQNAVAAVIPDRVLVVPAGIPPHKETCATPAALRLKMCECFRPAFPGLEISDIELNRTGKSYTVDTLEALRSSDADGAFYLCIGGDMLAGFTAWHRWQDILKMATLVAGGREGDAEQAVLEQAAEALRREGGQVILAPGPVLPLSSSAIRTALAAGDQSALSQVPPPADAIVRVNRLYMTEDAYDG